MGFSNQRAFRSRCEECGQINELDLTEDEWTDDEDLVECEHCGAQIPISGWNDNEVTEKEAVQAKNNDKRMSKEEFDSFVKSYRLRGFLPDVEDYENDAERLLAALIAERRKLERLESASANIVGEWKEQITTPESAHVAITKIALRELNAALEN